MKPLLILLAAAVFSSCAGYRVGSAKPAALSGVGRIAIPMLANNTQHPRAEVIATSAITGAFTRDGTYRIAAVGQADAVLEASVKDIRYASIRSRRLDTLSPEELSSTVAIDWVLKDARDPSRVLAAGSSTGHSQLFVDSDLQTARNNALPDAMERAGVAIVSRLANGF
jgi:hypothetical protein